MYTLQSLNLNTNKLKTTALLEFVLLHFSKRCTEGKTPNLDQPSWRIIGNMLKNTLLMVPQQKTDFKKIFSKKFEKSLIFFNFSHRPAAGRRLMRDFLKK